MPVFDFSDGALVFAVWLAVDLLKQKLVTVDPRLLAIVVGPLLFVARLYAMPAWKPDTAAIVWTGALVVACIWQGAILGLSAIGIDQAGGGVKKIVLGDKP